MFLTQKPIQLNEFLTADADPASGAAVIFFGMVRNHHLGKAVERLIYSCYESMAEKKLKQICEDLLRQFPVSSVRVLHRIGKLEIGEIAVVIEVLAGHRDEAYLASRATIERIKTEVPIWKKEFYTDGSSAWTLCEHVGKKTHTECLHARSIQ